MLIGSLLLSGCGGPADDPNGGDASAENKPAASPPAVIAKPPAPVSDGAFLDAALEGSIATIRQAIESGVDVNATDEEGRTALLLAAFNGHTEVVRLLLGRQAQLEHRDASGRTALMYASTGPNNETVRLLLEAGAEPNSVDSGEKFTALMHAAAEGQHEVVRSLLEFKADPRIRDIDGDTARDFAARNGHVEVVQLLTPLPNAPE